jgi:hypothetical protein
MDCLGSQFQDDALYYLPVIKDINPKRYEYIMGNLFFDLVFSCWVLYRRAISCLSGKVIPY